MTISEFHIKQVKKELTCTDTPNKIVLNKYENKVSKIIFDFDNTIVDGRLYFVMLNPITKKYSFTPIINSEIMMGTNVTVYPGIWKSMLIAVQDDYEIVDNDIDQSKVAFVSNEFARIVVRDNFLDEEHIESTNNPAIDKLLDDFYKAWEMLENAAIIASESATITGENTNEVKKLATQVSETYAQIIDVQQLIVDYARDIEDKSNHVDDVADTVVTLLSQVEEQASQVARICAITEQIKTDITAMRQDVESLKVEAEQAVTTAVEKASETATYADEAKSSSDSAKANADLVSANKIEIDNAKSDVDSKVEQFESDLETYSVRTLRSEMTELQKETSDGFAELKREMANKPNVNNQYSTLYMLSPNGTVYRVKISDNGVLYVDGVASDEEILDDLLPGRLLLWNDEFIGDLLNEEIWDYELGYIRNNEKQYYTNDSKNVYVSDSILHIVALRDNPADGYEWSSASIDSQFYANGAEGTASGFQRSTGFSYGYGLIEIKARCKTPSAGVWPAFWSRGASQQSEGWPMCGEIDIGELFYISAESAHRFNPGISWYDWHYLAQKSQHATNDGLSTGTAIYKNVDTNWHYYGMERSEAEMIFYFDRKEFCRISLTTLESSDILSAMRQPMSVKLNLAMGSTGGDIPEDLERAEYDIDYVRYYAPASVTESTDSGTWGFPDYMPTELAPNKIARIIPDRDMTDGKNQYLYWESSDPTKIDATSGLIRTKSGASGEVVVTMNDTFGNSKSATIMVKEDANCISDEVREIPTNPSIIPYGETSEIQVRLVPYWVTNHTVTAELETAIDGVTVSVTESSHAIAKYTTPCSIITIENNGTHTEDSKVNLIITAVDSGKTLTLPLTIKANKVEFDTTGMYAAYLYENTVESSSGVGTINDATGNNKDALTNLYYTTSYNNGICRVAGKGIQSQVQNGQFNPNTAEGFFLEEFNPEESRTFVFNIKAGMTEMRSQYNQNQGLLSVVHSGIGRNSVSNTTEGRHGFSFGYIYYNSAAEGYPHRIYLTPNGNVVGMSNLDTYLNPENLVNPEGNPIDYLHSDGFVLTFIAVYDAYNKTLSVYIIIDGKITHVCYDGLSRASAENYYNKGNYNIVLDTSVSESVLAESETDPFYWRYGNGNQICSDFVRAICVYDRVLTKDEMIDIANRLTQHYA